MSKHPRVAACLRCCTALFAAAFIAGSAVTQADLPDTVDIIRGSIVGVGTARPVRQPLAKGPPQRFLGTGFVVGNGLQIITNDHVVHKKIDTENKETHAIFTGRGRSVQVRPAILVRSDPEHDLALLQISGTPLPAMALAPDRVVREGEQIAFTGFPIGAMLGLYPVTHRGIVSTISPVVVPANSARQLTAQQIQRAKKDPFNVYQLDATAYPGNSGSPVYVQETGAVIGVINSVFIKETKETVIQKPSGISYAIPVKYVIKLLAGK